MPIEVSTIADASAFGLLRERGKEEVATRDGWISPSRGPVSWLNLLHATDGVVDNSSGCPPDLSEHQTEFPLGRRFYFGRPFECVRQHRKSVLHLATSVLEFARDLG
jgi:hypothetical protein